LSDHPSLPRRGFCGRTRREFFWEAGASFTGLALAGMLEESFFARQTRAATGVPFVNPLAAKPPMIAPRAKSVIFLFMYGGPSQVDTFDYKPLLYDLDGKTVPVKTKGRGGERNEGRVVGPKWRFQQHGQCGKWVSDLFPNVARHVDKIAFLHAMTADSPIHGSAMLQMNSGKILSGAPCLGSWVNYGLGSVNENLPGFLVMLDRTGGPISGAKNWSSGYMPATYQGTVLKSKGPPILDLAPPDDMPLEAQRAMLDALREANEEHLLSRGDNTELAARIASYELAWKMQEHAPEAVDLASETEETKRLYGLDSGGAHNDDNWDAHGDLVKNHEFHAGNTDQPVAALLEDLERTGLLDETLVIWGGEFGRQPTAEYAEGTGRDHNSYGFTMWLAGGGIKGGVSVGETDELGSAAISPGPGHGNGDKPGFHVKSLHATVLHCLGLDPNRLSYFFGGLDQKLVGVEHVEPIHEILA
jgi:hypothetical protein